MKKIKPIKAWLVTCDNKANNRRAFTQKSKAKDHAEFMNEEYSQCCKHEVIPVLITPIKGLQDAKR